MSSIIESRNIGRNFTLGEFSVVRECTTVGDDTEVREHCVIGCLPMTFANGKRLIPTGTVVIGSNVFINSHCDVVRALMGSTVIEDDVIMGQRVIVGHEAHVHRGVKLMNGVVLNGHVTVKEGAFLGSCAVVRERVTIGENSVVGMGSVVTKDVPGGVIAYGNPCAVHGDNTLSTKALRRVAKMVRGVL